MAFPLDSLSSRHADANDLRIQNAYLSVTVRQQDNPGLIGCVRSIYYCMSSGLESPTVDITWASI